MSALGVGFLAAFVFCIIRAYKKDDGFYVFLAICALAAFMIDLIGT